MNNVAIYGLLGNECNKSVNKEQSSKSEFHKQNQNKVSLKEAIRDLETGSSVKTKALKALKEEV